MEWNPGGTVTPPITEYLLEYRLNIVAASNWTAVSDIAPTSRRNVTGLYPFATYQVSVGDVMG